MWGNLPLPKQTARHQSTFVNGRYVVNATIGSAISNAFASYLMKRQYPFYILFIDIPPEVVDVNVHPNKADVRFENNQVIYGSIYSIISSVLDGNAQCVGIYRRRQRNAAKTGNRSCAKYYA